MEGELGQPRVEVIAQIASGNLDGAEQLRLQIENEFEVACKELDTMV